MTAVALNPIIPVVATQGAAQNLVLTPGTVIYAQVLKILANDLVQIAIADLTLDVTSLVPLQAGQALRLSVSQSGDGIRLAITDQSATSALARPGAPDSSGVADRVTLTSGAAVIEKPLEVEPATTPLLTPAETRAVVSAKQDAVTRQGSLAPLFADLEFAVHSQALPADVRQAAAQTLALRPPLDRSLDGDDVRSAFRQSGVFLEATLASTTSPIVGGVPDLKAALLVLRQTLLAVASSNDVSPAALPSDAAGQSPGRPSNNTAPPPSSMPTGTAFPPIANSAPSLDTEPKPSLSMAAAALANAPPLVPDHLNASIDQAALLVGTPEADASGATTETTAQRNLPAQQSLISEASLSEPELSADVLLTPQPATAVIANEAEADAPLPQTALRLLQEAAQAKALDVALAGEKPSPRGADASYEPQTPAGAQIRPSLVPPPFRGAMPAAQTIATPSLPESAPPAQLARHLIDSTEAALARTTLLQIASLPAGERATMSSLQVTSPSWSFEIPFATPQGTAMAQFEISRDGGGSTSTPSAKRNWQARFSLNVEPAGPVHALVSWSGDQTSVRLWAERTSTAAQLRASTAQLNHALHRAELSPGDIVVRDGAPLAPVQPPAGHFLNRAS